MHDLDANALLDLPAGYQQASSVLPIGKTWTLGVLVDCEGATALHRANSASLIDQLRRSGHDDWEVIGCHVDVNGKIMSCNMLSYRVIDDGGGITPIAYEVHEFIMDRIYVDPVADRRLLREFEQAGNLAMAKNPISVPFASWLGAIGGNTIGAILSVVTVPLLGIAMGTAGGPTLPVALVAGAMLFSYAAGIAGAAWAADKAAPPAVRKAARRGAAIGQALFPVFGIGAAAGGYIATMDRDEKSEKRLEANQKRFRTSR